MKKLEIGQRAPWESGFCNTTRAMRFTKMTRSSKCMQILREMITHPRQLTHHEIMQRVYKCDMGFSSQGFFSALRHFGLASFIRHGHQCLWAPTIEGITFYMSLPA